MAETKRTFEQDDLFDRKPYAKFLEKLILNSGSYHRDDDVQAYTIAIDSPWGTGKSVFLEKFENMLEADCPDQIRVVHYNAWQKDFWNNAFEPFANAIFSSEWFCNALERQTGAATAEKLLAAGRSFLIAYLKGHFEKEFDAEFVDKGLSYLTDAAGRAVSKYANSISKEYVEFTENLDLMQQAMAEVLDQTLPGGKLVIVIDELDRCRPTFAIETLEIVKHIMDVKDVVYIFSLDVRQIGAAIKQVYGADTDATGYLMRFFSYYSRMPGVLRKKIVEKIVEETNIEILDGENVNKEEYLNRFLNNMTSVSDALNLSARDLETVGKVYILMCQMFLADYKNSRAYLLYWFLLCSKYKNPVMFDEWIKNQACKITSPTSIEEQGKIPKQLTTAIQKMNKSYVIGRLDFCVKEDSGNDEYRAERQIMIGEETKGKIYIVDYPNAVDLMRQQYYLTKKGDLSDVLFYLDVQKWNKITGFTLKEYFASQLEMFNFIPEIPTATE